MMNDNLNLKSELLQVSQYIEIVRKLVMQHPSISIFKLITFTFIKKNEKYYFRSVYSGKDTKDLVLKCISQMTGKYQEFIESIEYIIMAIDILTKNEIIYIENGLVYSNDCAYECEETKRDFMAKAIDESFLYTDRQFMKEVVHNV